MKNPPLIEVLVQRFPSMSRDSLWASVLCGEVKSLDETLRDPKLPFDPNRELAIVRDRFVSRGGDKLEGVLQAWNIDVKGRVVLDAGASTGGFTDCLLRRGARFVHAVDVGKNQLAYSLRTDPRVSSMEKTNILSVESLDPMPDLAVADLSFCSVVPLASHIVSLTKENLLLCLVKPQFELNPQPPSFDGVIREPEVVKDVVRKTAAALRERGLGIRKAALSEVPGREGNREFFFLISSRGFDGEDPIPRALMELDGRDSP